MAGTVYEGMFILDANRYARDAAGSQNAVEKLIHSAGGEILVSRLWEERKLAYPIMGHRKGIYWLTYFRIDTQQISPMTRQCEINDLLLRQLFIRLDPKLVDTIIAHASGTPAPESETEPSTEESAPVAEVATTS